MDDLVAKRQQGAQEFMGIVDQLAIALGEAAELAAEFNSAGLVFEDADFVGAEGNVIGHLDAGLMNAALALFDYTNPASLIAYMQTPTGSGLSAQDTIARIRP